MTKPSVFLAGAALLGAPLVAGCGTTAPASSTAPARAASPAIPRLDVDVQRLAFPDVREVALPDIERVELPNGLTVFLVEDRQLPLVRATARIGTGALFDPAGKVGLSSIAAQTMRSGGAGALAPDALNAALESRGASIEVFAGQDAVTASMRSLTEHVDEVLPLFVDVLARPRFDEGQVTLARTQQRTGIARRNDNPQGIATRELFKALYGADNPYARTTEYWTVDAIGQDDLQAWHAQHVRPGNTLLAVWGDFDAAEMAGRLRQAFAAWPGQGRTERAATPPAPTARRPGLYFIQKDDVTQSTILIGHPGAIRFDHPDYPALVVMNEVLGGGFSSRLFQRVRSDLGLAYSVFGTYTAGYEQPGVFYAGTYTKTESTTDAVRAMQEVIGTMQTRPPTAAELGLAKDSYLNSFVFNFDSRAKVLGRQLTYAYYGYPDDFIQQQQARIAAVTADDVQRVARQYLHPSEATILVLGNAADMPEPVSALGAAQTIDITIPTAPPGGASAPGAQAGGAAPGSTPGATPGGRTDERGQAILAEVLQALGGAERFRAVRTSRVASTSEVQTPMGALSIGGTAELAYPDRVRVVQQTPVGNVTIVLNGRRGRIETPQGAQPAPPPVVEQVQGQVALDLLFLLAQADHLEARALPASGGLRVVELRAPGIAQPVRLVVGADGRPVRVEASQVGPAGPAEAVVTLSDYRTVDGLLLPYAYTLSQGGEAQGSTVVQRIEINPVLAESLFEVGS